MPLIFAPSPAPLSVRLGWHSFCNDTFYKETYISIEGHVWKITGAVIIYDASYFVGKCSKAEHVGNGFVLNIIDFVVWRMVG